MKHEMRLQNNPFLKIKQGSKTIEMRLYDEKRKLVKVGDIIEFTNVDTLEKICVKVIKLHLFKNFDELYKNLNKVALGYNGDEVSSSRDMEKYYSKEEEKLYGVVGIEIKLIKNT